MRTLLPVGLVLVCVSVVAWAANERPTVASREAENTSVRIVVEIIEAVVDQGVIQMDLQTIDPGQHRVEKILEVLRKRGQAALATRFDGQIVPGGETNLSSGQNVPFVTGVTLSPQTKSVVNNVQYRQIGTQCRLNTIRKNDELIVTGRLEWTGGAPTGIAIAQGIMAPAYISSHMDFSSATQPNKPVLLSMAVKLPEQPDKSRMAQAIITRLTIMPNTNER